MTVTRAPRTRRRPGRRLRLVRQFAQTECGLCCCAMVLRACTPRASITDLRQRYVVGRDGLNIADLCAILRAEGTVPHVYETTAAGVAALRGPVICYWNGNHYVVVVDVARRGVLVLDPGNGRRWVSTQEFAERFSGLAITADDTGHVRESALGSELGVLLGFARERAGLLLGVLLLSLATALVTLGIPRLLTSVFGTSAASSRAVPYLLVCGLGIAYACLLLVRSVVAVVASTAVGRSMSERVFDRLLRLPYSYFATRGVGELLFTLDAVQTLRSLIATDVIMMLVGAVLVVTLLAWLASLSLAALVVAALLIGVLVALTALSGAAVREASLEETRQRAALQTIQVSAIAGLETIKSNALESEYVGTWRGVNDKVLRQFVRLQTIRSVFTSTSAGIQFIGPILVLVVVTQSRAAGAVSPATIVSVQALSGFLLGQVSIVAGSITQVAQGWTLLERVADVLLHPVDATFRGPRTAVTEPSVRLDDVEFAYATFSAPVLRGICLEIPAGCKAAIVGPSGSGKSTLGRLLVGLHTPTSGRVEIGGVGLEEYTREGFHRSVAYVPQTVVLDQGSVRDNIAWGSGGLSDDDVVAAARRVGLHDEIVALPFGYQTPVALLGQNFSGGQRQRIALARAALKDASIVVLDEATSSLDNRAESLVTGYFDTFSSTRVVIAHRLSTIVDADVIFVLDEGRLVEHGSHDELMRAGGLYRELYAQSDGAASSVQPTEEMTRRA